MPVFLAAPRRPCSLQDSAKVAEFSMLEDWLPILADMLCMKLFQVGGLMSEAAPSKPVYHTMNHLQSKFIFPRHLKTTQKPSKITSGDPCRNSFPLLLSPQWNSVFLHPSKAKQIPKLKSNQNLLRGGGGQFNGLHHIKVAKDFI